MITPNWEFFLKPTLKEGLHPGDLVTEAWNTEKFMSAYAQTKKFDNKVETTSSWADNKVTL